MRATSRHESGFGEHIEMVGEEAGRQIEPFTEFAWRPVAGRQLVDDGEANRLAERGVHLHALSESVGSGPGHRDSRAGRGR